MPKPTEEELTQIENWFMYHQPTPEQEEAYRMIRVAALTLATTILEKCPASADRTAALRKLRECVATANASIACAGK